MKGQLARCPTRSAALTAVVRTKLGVPWKTGVA